MSWKTAEDELESPARPEWWGKGLGNPGTSVANIACTASGLFSPRAWYHNRKNLEERDYRTINDILTAAWPRGKNFRKQIICMKINLFNLTKSTLFMPVLLCVAHSPASTLFMWDKEANYNCNLCAKSGRHFFPCIPLPLPDVPDAWFINVSFNSCLMKDDWQKYYNVFVEVYIVVN